jgi:hypothetical protein
VRGDLGTDFPGLQDREGLEAILVMKIFVSSMYTDLIEYRKAAERAINLLDQQFKGKEYFGARKDLLIG